MTGRRPICPECRSDQIVPDATNGGAGRNRCAVCNHVSAVRDFYPEPSTTDPMPWIGKDERRYGTLGTPEFRDMFMQQPEPPTPGYRMNPKTGKLRPAKPHELHYGENPAPIRQYKDD